MAEGPWWHEEPGDGSDSIGSAGDEAARLFTAMRDRLLSDPTALRAGLRIMETFSSLTSGGGRPVAPGEAPECAYCPVCQAIRRAQSVSPDAVERVTGAALEFAETVRQAVSQPTATADDGLRHVPLDEDFEDWPEPVEVESDDSAEMSDSQQPGAADQ